MVVALGNIKQLSIGRFEFRKRIPERHRGRLGKGEFKRVFQAATAADIAREHARVLAEYDAFLNGASAPEAHEASEGPLNKVLSSSTGKIPPKKTYADAAALYEQDRLENGANTKGVVTLRRVCSRMEAALHTRLCDLALTELTREDARRVRDYMLQLPKKCGGTLSAESVKRDLVIMSAML
ncbi:hypothetical protein LAZ29_17060 [Cereibacter sphaeroides]|uniref:hypothetical protein n=1 Tax=Cereibacter sphaeroides TaxID=1063 RepID=UPI001F285B0A|nr:hypothetical protein [Cereibacter sphaeroides]MCE6952644.1 hypothetical protein [Cereibacter sphaeroides]